MIYLSIKVLRTRHIGWRVREYRINARMWNERDALWSHCWLLIWKVHSSSLWMCQAFYGVPGSWHDSWPWHVSLAAKWHIRRKSRFFTVFFDLRIARTFLNVSRLLQGTAILKVSMSFLTTPKWLPIWGYKLKQLQTIWFPHFKTLLWSFTTNNFQR